MDRPDEVTETTLTKPSRFWEKLGEVHARGLQAGGFEQIKRQQALQYFTWRWSFAASNNQMHFLLRHSSPLSWLRAAIAPAELSDSAWDGIGWRRSERRMYTTMVRLLWGYAARQDRLKVLALPEPAAGHPLPVAWKGRLISQDLANSALEVNAIARALDGRRPNRIIEVGAGYGRTAYVFLCLFPQASYTIVDIEPALSISRWYLSQLFAAERLRFLLPQDAVHLQPSSFDLGLTISSLQEMTEEQVRGYLSLFDRLVAPGTVYLKQWREWANPEDGLTLRFESYPIPRRWTLRFREPAPVQTKFIQAAWDVP